MIPLCTFYVACCAQAKVKNQLDSLKVGDVVEIRPDPTNPFDSQAISCHIRDIWLGFMPAKLTHYIHPYFKEELPVEAVLTEINAEGPVKELLRIKVSVVKALEPDKESDYVIENDKDARRTEFLQNLDLSNVQLNSFEASFVDSCKVRRSYTPRQREIIDKLMIKFGEETDLSIEP